MHNNSYSPQFSSLKSPTSRPQGAFMRKYKNTFFTEKFMKKSRASNHQNSA